MQSPACQWNRRIWCSLITLFIFHSKVCVLSVISMVFNANFISCCVILPKYLGIILYNQQTFFFLLPLSRATVFTSRTSLSINVCCLERKFRRFCQSAFPFNNVCKETMTTYIKVNITFIDNNFFVIYFTILSVSQTIHHLSTLRTGAFKLFKCTFPGSKQFKSTFILCFFKYL